MASIMSDSLHVKLTPSRTSCIPVWSSLALTPWPSLNPRMADAATESESVAFRRRRSRCFTFQRFDQKVVMSTQLKTEKEDGKLAQHRSDQVAREVGSMQPAYLGGPSASSLRLSAPAPVAAC